MNQWLLDFIWVAIYLRMNQKTREWGQAKPLCVNHYVGHRLRGDLISTCSFFVFLASSWKTSSQVTYHQWLTKFTKTKPSRAGKSGSFCLLPTSKVYRKWHAKRDEQTFQRVWSELATKVSRLRQFQRFTCGSEGSWKKVFLMPMNCND